MRLSELLTNIFSLPAKADRDVARLILDSRQIQAQDLFLAVKGTQQDGRQYIDDAISRGAVAVMVDADEQNETLRWQKEIPLIPIYQLQQQLGKLGARFYDYPAKKLRMIGVTGTNGKTSCTHYIAEVLQALNIPCGVIGTLGSGMYGALGEVGLTTPDAITLQATLHALVTKGAKAVAMEVSSHSIDQGRANDIAFEIGVFTNLTQDHLDYHGTMDAYAAVKKRFLTEFPLKNLVINADDDFGAQWIKELSAQHAVYSYSVLPQKQKEKNFIYADHIKLTLQGAKANVFTPWGEGELTLPLIGRFNVSNALAVLSALCLYGLPLGDVLRHLAHLRSAPGRMQTISRRRRPLVVVDYSHTPDALEKALQALRFHVEGKLICVFGCGGDRDPGKRPKMAAIAEKLADQVIVTNDNPRHENPQKIAEQILAGFSAPKQVKVILDRSKAIEKSIQLATVDDCILIAGKGAEHYQQIGDVKTPFDDVEQASNYLDHYVQRV